MVVLISGGGSNLRALLEASEDAEFPARVVAVGADRDADGLAHAEEFGIPSFVVSFGAYATRDEWGDALLDQLRQWDAELVVLSGFMRLLPPRVVAALSPWLLNTHPAFLPEFPGAHAVRDAIEAGVSQTGASVIIVDDGVDSGPIVAQRRIPVLPGDTEAPAARTHQGRRARAARAGRARHRQWRTGFEGARIMSGPQIDPALYRERDLVPIRRALVSVSDKTGLLELAAALVAAGVEIVSTGSTAKTIAHAGHPVTEVGDLTGYPESLDGRVRTLHPRVHSGLLADLRLESHEAELEAQGIAPFELLVSNLYPFQETVASGAEPDAVVEQIDIGGPAMVRAAAKNHANVAVVVSPARYGDIVDALANGGTSLAERRALALEAFRHTASYDVAVATWMGSVLAPDDEATGFPEWVGATWTRSELLRYGENSHQRAALYGTPARSGDRPGHTAGRQGDVVQQLRRRGCRGARRVRPRAPDGRDHQAREPVRHRDRRRRSPRRTRSRTPAIRSRRTAESSPRTA